MEEIYSNKELNTIILEDFFVEEMIQNLGAIINIPSVYEETSEEKAPFGRGIRRALDTILELGHSFGLQSVDYDGYAAELTAGTGDYMIGFLCHIDVVSAGNGWNTDAFQMTRVEDRLYGRGTLDDKGPLMSTLYAMRYLKEHDLIPQGVCIRMIIGMDEEESWRCIQYYKEHANRLPDVSIVPDGNFPMIHCEKGLIDADLRWTEQRDSKADIQLISLSGGVGRNTVPDIAHCELRTIHPFDLIRKLNLFQGVTVEIKEDVLSLTVAGKSVHAMTPEKGVNAIAKLISVLQSITNSFSHKGFLDQFSQYIGDDFTGARLSCNLSDEISGTLTFNLGSIAFETDNFQMKCNVRYPVTYTQVPELLKKQCEAVGFGYEQVDFLPPIHLNPKEPFLEALLSAYRQVTGDHKSQPFAIGGATYARALPNAVAFGPLFPDEEELAHEPNEFISINSLKKMTEIYILALRNLIKLR